MRVAILGAGAVGGLVAFALGEAGHEVTLLARGPHLDAIRTHGLHLLDAQGQGHTMLLHAMDDPAALGPQDALVTTVKAPALAGLLEAMPAKRLRDTPVITALNGVFWWYAEGFRPQGRSLDTRRLDPGGRLAAALSPASAIGAVIHSTNQLAGPGKVVNRSEQNRLFIGGPGQHGAIQALAQSLDGPRLRIEAPADIRRVMWHKLLRNLSSAPISVLTGGRVREIFDDFGTAGLARGLFLEGAAIAAAHGFTGLGDDVDEVIAPGKGALQQPSMRQDLNLGKPLEIETMLAIVQDFGREAACPTPLLDTLLPLIRLAERHHRLPPPI